MAEDEIGSVQSLSQVQLFATPWAAAHQASLSLINSWSLLKLIYIELVMPSKVLASASVLPMNIQDRYPLGGTGWISLQSRGLSRVFSNTTVQKHQFFTTQLFLWSYSHPYMATIKTMVLTRWIFVNKVMSLLFNMLSRLVIAFLPRSNCLLISWL